MIKNEAAYQFGEIVLLQFPFTDFKGFKKRPALVIYDDIGNDIVVCRITSQAKESDLDITIEDWSTSALKLPSIVKLHKIATIQKSLIDRKMGVLSIKDLAAITARIKSLITSNNLQ